MERVRTAGQGSPARPASSGPSTSSKVLVIVLVLVGLVVIAAMFFGLSRNLSSGNVKSDQYQAVFLTNGQVYFGKMSNINSDYVTLEDIFYLQVTQQTTGDDALQSGDNAAVDPQISLAQLGNELHGPESEMFISREQILFWENLTDEGDVVTAITNFQSGQTDTPAVDDSGSDN
ncbi:TPA: hypothetical protein EYO12_03500 [Candidatus Saccharibacteria bacterium]|nr:hypothetical protein [Candidatus Saccharibacteria bacterium]HIO87904.1 hypothetical protein [Candidatus Saccharibacteria bacterium]